MADGGSVASAQLLIMAAVMAECVAGLWVLQNSYALLVGILIGFLDALPFIGTGTILLPWAALELFRGDFFHAAAYLTSFSLPTARGISWSTAFRGKAGRISHCYRSCSICGDLHLRTGGSFAWSADAACYQRGGQGMAGSVKKPFLFTGNGMIGFDSN